MISLLVTIVVIGFICWLLVTLIPMPAPFPKVIVAVACIVVLLLVLRAFGLWNGFGDVRIH